MSDKQKRAERRKQQAQEIEESQRKLRESIAETDRLVDEFRQDAPASSPGVRRRRCY